MAKRDRILLNKYEQEQIALALRIAHVYDSPLEGIEADTLVRLERLFPISEDHMQLVREFWQRQRSPYDPV